MNLNEMLPAGGIEALAGQLGIPQDQARRGAEALLPSILAGMGGQGGAGDVESHVNTLGGAQLADNVVSAEPTDVDKGNQLLGGIFGSKDTSRKVATQASQTSGIDPALLKQMLPILAMLVAGYLSRRSGGQPGGLGGILGSVLGSLGGQGSVGQTGGGQTGGALGDILGGALGANSGGAGRGLGGGLGGILGSVLGGGKR